MWYYALSALSIVTSLMMWRISQHPVLVAEHRAVRNHLIEFMRVWIALSAYYILHPLAIFLPDAAEPIGSICAIQYLPPPFLWHFCVALILGLANIWLRRAGLELEISELPQNKERLVLPLETLGSNWQRFLKWCTEAGILYGFLAALIPLGFIPSLTQSRAAMSLAYSFQLLVTSLLFVRLGLAYRNVLGSNLLFGLSIGYSIIQLPYGILVPTGTFSVYEVPLGLFKIAHGASLAMFCQRYARRQVPPPQETPTAESLSRLAKRLQTRATLSGVRQLIIAGALSMIGLLVLSGLYTCTMSYLRGFALDQLSLLPVRLVFFLALLLVWQICGYMVVAKLRFRISWTDHKELLQHFSVDVQEPGASVPGVELVSITAKSAGVGLPQQQVVLLHGLFSSGAAAWGLLPLVLIREGGVNCVRSLTYSHGLFTQRRTLDQIARDVATKIASLIGDFPGRTLVIGHSLGGIIVLKILPELIRNTTSGLRSGLHHVGIVGAPLLGSGFAKVLFPWPWSRMLGRRSRLLEETLRDALSVIPPVGSATDGEILIPGLTFVYGSRDSVAGELVQFAAFHGEKIRAPAFHGLGLVFYETQGLARVYQRMLSAVPRAVLLAKAIGSGLAPEQFLVNGLFVFSDELRMASAQLIGSAQEEQRPGHIPRVQEPVERRLKDLYERGSARAGGWDTYWTELEKDVERSAAPGFHLRNWSEEHLLLLYVNRFAGFFAIVPKAGRWLSDGARRRLPSTAFGPVSSAILTAFRDLDPPAVSAVVLESCEHLATVQTQSFFIESADFTTAVDSEGSYYGIYAFDGVIGHRAGVDHICLHIGAPGQPLSLSELALSCYDEVRSVRLATALVELGQNCWLCKVNLGAILGYGERVGVRLSFRRQSCINLLHGFELFRLEPIFPAGARVSMRLSLPGRVFALDAFKVKEGKLAIETPLRTEDSLERKYAYSIESDVEAGDQAIGVRFAVDPATTERRRLRDMITIDRARGEDLPRIAGMESILSVRVPATLGDLRNRFASFSEGMLVARIGAVIIGYIEFVRWSRERPQRFRDVSEIHIHHEADGRSAFIWFLAVLPAFRGRGIGRRLISEVVNWSEKAGIRQIQIITQSEMKGYFEDIGFKKVSDIVDFMPDMTGTFMARGVVL